MNKCVLGIRIGGHWLVLDLELTIMFSRIACPSNRNLLVKYSEGKPSISIPSGKECGGGSTPNQQTLNRLNEKESTYILKTAWPSKLYVH